MTNPLSDELTLAAAWLRQARHVVLFTGAGASAESGIPTFRDVSGLWQRFPVERFANWASLVRMSLTQPEEVIAFAHAILKPIAEAEPNAGHRAIAAMEQHTEVTVVTQNIDNLHQEAGSTTVREVHGTLFEVVDERGNMVGQITRAQMRKIVASLDTARKGRFTLLRAIAAVRPLAGLGLRHIHRPRVVLFGDAMAEPDWTLALEACRRADLLIQVGCSRAVYPAAMLPHEARATGARVIAVDPSPAEEDLWLEGTAATVLPSLVRTAFGT